ncbi:hypothetical protein [Ancylomarina longa]|uniref:Uncharacterized protein n=1 Tax=Ancylomarina longa TaxID=2487017 RepID=A0A434AGD5_9BACT|nr:hypothetical protein [Ancylomarina longa]RUT73451.1 hypothetical protein DLK05_13300 [Ancylomarina longa]
MNFNDQEVIIDCPHCKGEMVVKILEITNHQIATCPACNKKVDLAANDPSARLGIPKTYMPFEGLDEYMKEVEEKRKKK